MKEVIFRPACGLLSEAMSKKQSFSGVCEMLDHVIKLHDNAFAREEIHLTYYCYDSRIDWETFLVTVDRIHNERYDVPQAIGYCTFK